MDLSNILKMVTDNPAILQTALSFAGKFKDNAAGSSGISKENDTVLPHEISPLPAVKSQNRARDNERQLLLALRPYLSEGRQDKIDFVLKILQLLELAGNLGLNFDIKTKGSDLPDV